MEILVRTAIEIGKGRPNNTAKIPQRLFINLVTVQEFSVIAKVTKKPTELPQRTFGAVKASGEGKCFKGSWLQDAEAQHEERFLRMPAIGGHFHAGQK